MLTRKAPELKNGGVVRWVSFSSMRPLLLVYQYLLKARTWSKQKPSERKLEGVKESSQLQDSNLSAFYENQGLPLIRGLTHFGSMPSFFIAMPVRNWSIMRRHRRAVCCPLLS